MQVRVLLFGPEARALGTREATVEVTPPVTCAQVLAALASQFPSLGTLGNARLAVNAEFAAPSFAIAPGDEVALIGMVSGG